MTEPPKTVLDLWRETNAQIAELKEDTLQTERVYYNLRNWTPTTSPIEIVDVGYIEISNWPVSIGPEVLAEAGTSFKIVPESKTRDLGNFEAMLDGVFIRVSYAPSQR